MRSMPSADARRGAAAVEMAFLMPLLLALIVGVWEIGSLIQAQQIMNNAAREGARLASQAVIINTTGTYTNVTVSSSSPSVTSAVTQYLAGNGITNLAGLQVSFQFLSGDTTLTDPYQGSTNQQFVVTVSLPYSNVQWSPLGLVNPTTVGSSCIWQLMVEAPFSVSTTMPSWAQVTNSN